MRQTATAQKSQRLVYSYVATDSLPSIRAHGLHSGKSLLKNPQLLAAAATSRGMSSAAMAAQIRKSLRSPWQRPASLGPNVLFTPISPEANLAHNHPTKQRKMTMVAVDLERLLRDQPKTTFHGMELTPYAAETKHPRQRRLSRAEVRRFTAMPAQRLWRAYADLSGRGQYAPNVPHAAIHTPSGHIGPEYLRIGKQPMSAQHTARGFFKTAIPIALPMLGKALASPFGQMAASAALGKMQSVPAPPKTPPPIKPANPMATPGRF